MKGLSRLFSFYKQPFLDMWLYFFFHFKNEFKHLLAKTYLSFGLFSNGKIFESEKSPL